MTRGHITEEDSLTDSLSLSRFAQDVFQRGSIKPIRVDSGALADASSRRAAQPAAMCMDVKC